MESTVVIAAHVAAGLVLVAGVAKLARPATTGAALGWRLGTRARLAVRALGLAEVALAVAVLVLGGSVAFGLLGAAYLGFTAVAWHQRRHDRGCGCFGTEDTQVGALHLVANLVAAATAATAAAALVGPGLPTLLATAPIAAVTATVLIALAVGLGQLVLTGLSEVLAASRTVLTGDGS